ncbi:DUF1801 domain-containing protein [Glutamicibacter sp. TV12E]|uniref:DUF1801 domain-containing protein n=1 Tax=Glutamicibacter sp. TV12E TaxID=3446362 RepID=UPI004034B420
MAATQKTLPTNVDPHAFIAAATPEKRRVDGEALEKIFSEATGEKPVMWGPSIVGYGTYVYASPANPKNTGTWPKTGFSPRKAQLSLYGLKDLPEGEALLPQLGKYTEGAGCVYVKKLEDINVQVLKKLIAIAAARPDQGAS